MDTQRWHSWIPWIGFVLALMLRLWHLGTPPELVSDEVFFVNDGWSYSTGQTYFDPHPPLGKMAIGLSMELFGNNPVAWRVVNAVEGAIVVPLLWWIAWRLTKRRSAAAIAVVLGLLDGLFLVDSRLGLINIPYLVTALAAFACVLKALDVRRSWCWLVLGGLLLGASVATKWLGSFVGAPMLVLWIWPRLFGFSRHPDQPGWTRWFGIGALTLIPLLVYWLVFVVHFSWLEAPTTFWTTNLQMLNYHLSVPPAGDPNQQPWWGWLLAWKPFPYWESATSTIRSLPNPWIWWSGAGIFLFSLVRGWRDGTTRLLNTLLLCAWIPFAFIQRVMYSYHAMLFDLWLILLIAVTLSRQQAKHRRLVVAYVAIAVLVFIWFAPWYLNIPLSLTQHHLREWLPSWRLAS